METGVLADGGRVAARGFQYQYRRTLEAMIGFVDDPAVSAVRVEGPPVGSAAADVVDFDVLEPDGSRRLVAQVKSKAPGAAMSAAEAFGVLARLAGGEDAARYELLTNAEPGAGARELSEALAGRAAPRRVYAALHGLLISAPKRLRELERLVADHPERLTRLRLSFDRRDDAELTSDLRERLRYHRNRAREGLGEQTAGLLSGYLVAEILRRAADADHCVYTMEEFRAHLLVDGQYLARLRGGKDWGIIVGPMSAVPDVPRPALLQKVTAALSDPGQPGVRRVALVGPSGIGKSSLAAAYVADRADSYNVIFWVDAANDASLLDSFRAILAALRGVQALAGYSETVHQLRTDVHRDLSGMPGPWLMIFDNARGPRQIEPWIPPLGHGDVLVSCIDSAARYGSAAVIDVTPMDRDESVALLATRLRVERPGDPSCRGALARLADALGHWPLALELAAGYLDSCGIGLDRIDHYLDKLKIRSLSDSASLPPSYPRTLAAAIDLCLEDLSERTAQRIDEDPPLLALGMLRLSAYLTSRQIPVELLGASVVIADADDPQHVGPLGVPRDQFNLAEDVRELRRFSLVSADFDLPAMGQEAEAGFDRTISVNSVVQDLVRAGLDRHPQTSSSLDRMAFHLDRWHSAAMDLGDLSRAYVMFTHAETLVEHLRRLGVSTNRTGLLCGNLAGAYRAQGDTARAIQLLREEIEHVRGSDEPNEVLIAQAKLALADILLDERTDGDNVDPPEVVRYLQDVLDFAEAIAGEYPRAAVKLAYYAVSFLERPDATERLARAEIARLSSAFRELLAGLPASPLSDALSAVRRASVLTSAGQPAEAEQTIRQVLRSGVVLGAPELEARRLLVETVVHQQQWAIAREELAQLRARFGTVPMYPPVVSQLVHNVGLACALQILLLQEKPAARLLGELLDWPATSFAAARATRGRRGRLHLLGAVRLLAEGAYPLAERALHELQPDDLDEGNPAETVGWTSLWQMARLAVLRDASPL